MKSESQLSPEDSGQSSLDISLHWIAHVLDRSPLGVFQTDLEGRLLYANPKAKDICGLRNWRNTSVHTLFPDPVAWATVQAQLLSRLQGFSDEYEVEIARLDDGRRVPIKVAAMPVCTPDSRVLGALGIIRSLETERAARAIHDVIDKATGSSELLTRVAEEIGKVMPYDLLVASVYSADARHARVLLEYPVSALDSTRRWYVLTQAQETLVKDTQVSAQSLAELAALTPSREIQSLMDQGFTSLLRFPVHSEGRPLGSLSVLRKGASGFYSRELDLFRELPLARTLLMALFFASQEEFRFRFQLLKAINQCKTDNELFNLVVERIVDHYPWSYVSLFTVDDVEARIVLRSQKARHDQALLPANYCQARNDGILGYVWRTGQDANVGDVRADPDFKTIVVFTDKRPTLVSELSMAILSEGRIYALLNIEDSRQSAFSKDEQLSLRELLDEIGTVIDRRRRDNLATAAVASTPTAVLLVDANGIIRKANPAAERFLGYRDEDLYGKSISEFVKCDSAALLDRNPGEPVELLSQSGSRRVLVGVSVIDASDNRRMITLRDISLVERAQQLEDFARLYADVARQTKTPLLLASAALEELRSLKLSSKPFSLFGARNPLEQALPDLVDEILGQLQRVDLAYDEIQLRAINDSSSLYRPVRLCLNHFLADVIHDLPESLERRIKSSLPPDQIYITGDLYQLTFVIQTMTLHLLRLSPPKQNVTITVEATEQTVETRGEAQFSGDPTEYLSKQDLTSAKALVDISLRRPILEQFLKNHGGLYDKPEFSPGSIRTRFSLPRASIPK
jgi:PAS domain S-box-containing protein